MLTRSIKDHYKQSIPGKVTFKQALLTPRITKVIVHRSLGTKAQDNKVFKQSVEELRLITGQQPAITRVKKSIATFKIRANTPIGLKVTLRGNRMYCFLDRLLHLVLPQVKDFQGFRANQFDDEGNYNLGIVDQSVFPEIETNFNDIRLGLDITLVTNLTSRSKAQQFFSELGFPFRIKA